MYAPALLLGIASLLLVRRFAPSHQDISDPIDWLELAAFGTGILGLGAFLNLGPGLGWTASPLTYVLAFVGVAGFVVFALRYRRARGRFVNLNLLRDRNLALATLIAFGVAATCTGQIETAELATVLNLSGFFIGVRGALGGVAWLVGVLGGGWLVAHIGARRALLAAMLVLVWGRFGYTSYAPGLDMIDALWPNIVTSVGYGLAGTSLAVLAFQNVPKRLSDVASSLYVLGWQLGPALGVALLNGFIATREAAMILQGVNQTEASVLAALDAIWLEFAYALVLVPMVYWFRAREPRLEVLEPSAS
ncbi:MAG: MFS transporter [Alphaproteobacteria bacterium]|nr:MFS transporter [Alphaproteobacteria bacterium]